MAITDKQLERYARHIVMDEVGEEGQEKLLASKVLVIGAGGLGSPVLMYLAAAGVGTLGVIDFDVVDTSNLQRQIVHGTENIGDPKVASAAERLHDINPSPPAPNMVPRCETAGIFGAVAGVIGTLQATEVLKELLGLGNSLAGRLMLYEGLSGNFRTLTVKRDPACALCGAQPTIEGLAPVEAH